jgi:hypothetical protein
MKWRWKKMLRKLGIPILAMAAALAVAVPSVTIARDRDDHRGDDHHEAVRRDFHGDRDRFRGGWNIGVGVYPAPVPVPVAPPPAPSGYYDQYGVWHPYVTYPNGYYGY